MTLKCFSQSLSNAPVNTVPHIYSGKSNHEPITHKATTTFEMMTWKSAKCKNSMIRHLKESPRFEQREDTNSVQNIMYRSMSMLSGLT